MRSVTSVPPGEPAWKSNPRAQAARQRADALAEVSTAFRSKAAQFRLTVGLNWKGANLRDGRFLVRGLLAFLDRRQLGSNFQRKPSSLRAWAYLVPAHQNGGRLHFHGVLRFPRSHTDVAEVAVKIEKFRAKNWKLADIHLDELDPRRSDEWAGYCLKEEALPDQAITSFDFHKAP